MKAYLNLFWECSLYNKANGLIGGVTSSLSSILMISSSELLEVETRCCFELLLIFQTPILFSYVHLRIAKGAHKFDHALVLYFSHICPVHLQDRVRALKQHYMATRASRAPPEQQQQQMGRGGCAYVWLY